MFVGFPISLGPTTRGADVFKPESLRGLNFPRERLIAVICFDFVSVRKCGENSDKSSKETGTLRSRLNQIRGGIIEVGLN